MDIDPNSESKIDFTDLTTADIGVPVSPARLPPKERSYKFYALGVIAIVILVTTKLMPSASPTSASSAYSTYSPIPMDDNLQRTIETTSGSNMMETPSSQIPPPRTFITVTRGDLTEPWSPETLLQTGDSVHAKVLAHTPSLAWLAVYSSNGLRVSTEQQIAASLVSANPEISEEFTEGITIKEIAGGEVLVIVICSRLALEHHYPSSLMLSDWLDGVMRRDMNFMDGCLGHRVQLR